MKISTSAPVVPAQAPKSAQVSPTVAESTDAPKDSIAVSQGAPHGKAIGLTLLGAGIVAGAAAGVLLRDYSIIASLGSSVGLGVAGAVVGGLAGVFTLGPILGKGGDGAGLGGGLVGGALGVIGGTAAGVGAGVALGHYAPAIGMGLVGGIAGLVAAAKYNNRNN